MPTEWKSSLDLSWSSPSRKAEAGGNQQLARTFTPVRLTEIQSIEITRFSEVSKKSLMVQSSLCSFSALSCYSPQHCCAIHLLSNLSGDKVFWHNAINSVTKSNELIKQLNFISLCSLPVHSRMAAWAYRNWGAVQQYLLTRFLLHKMLVIQLGITTKRRRIKRFQYVKKVKTFKNSSSFSTKLQIYVAKKKKKKVDFQFQAPLKTSSSISQTFKSTFLNKAKVMGLHRGH